MLEGVPQTEQKEQEATLDPFAERGGADGRHEHQKIDLERPVSDMLDGLLGREIPAKKVGRPQGRELHPWGRKVDEFWEQPAEQHEKTGGQGKAEFHPRVSVAVTMTMAVVVVAVVIAVIMVV